MLRCHDVQAQGADQVTIDVDAEAIAIRQVIKLVADHAIRVFGHQIIQPIGRVAQPVDVLEILAAFAASILRPLQQGKDVASKC